MKLTYAKYIRAVQRAAAVNAGCSCKGHKYSPSTPRAHWTVDAVLDELGIKVPGPPRKPLTREQKVEE